LYTNPPLIKKPHTPGLKKNCALSQLDEGAAYPKQPTNIK